VSKLERQLDDVFGEERVEILWPSDEEVDVELLRLQLISEIDAHAQRIPLDLRGVRGAPEQLVDLLLEMQRYATSQSKVISISASLPAMQEALNPRRRRKAGRPQEAIDEQGARNASEVAKTAIRSRGGDNPQTLLAVQADEKAETRVRSRTTPRLRSDRNLALLASILGLFAAAVLTYRFFTDETKPVIVPTKSFESESETRTAERVISDVRAPSD
jgi:hypothetical protein